MAEGEAFGELLERIFSKGKVGLEKAARVGRDQIHLRQLRSDRDKLYQKLGKEAKNLLDAGEIVHPGLSKAIERVVELEKRIQDAEDALRVGDQAPVPENAVGTDKK